MDRTRASFEAAMRASFPNTPLFTAGGTYTNGHTKTLWRLWQAARNHGLAEAVEACQDRVRAHHSAGTDDAAGLRCGEARACADAVDVLRSQP